MKNYGVQILILLSLLSAGAMSKLMAAEEAEYKVTRQEGQIELRDYASAIVAETLVNDNFEDASKQAFKALFAYISGKNRAKDKIDMISPVSQEARSEKIAMTSPVGQRASGDAWAVSFMMPAGHTLETLPQPLDPSVILREMPAYRAATIRYSGRWTEENYQQNLGELKEWMRQNGLEASAEPVWARYNPPFTPWFMRRNEILIAVR